MVLNETSVERGFLGQKSCSGAALLMKPLKQPHKHSESKETRGYELGSVAAMPVS